MKKETIAKSAKTGKIVSKDFAKKNPDTTFEVPKPKRKPKEFIPDAPTLPDYLALVGLKCIFTKGDESFVAVIESLDPLRVVKYEVKDSVITTNEIDLTLADFTIKADKDEAFIRLAG